MNRTRTRRPILAGRTCVSRTHRFGDASPRAELTCLAGWPRWRSSRQSRPDIRPSASVSVPMRSTTASRRISFRHRAVRRRRRGSFVPDDGWDLGNDARGYAGGADALLDEDQLVPGQRVVDELAAHWLPWRNCDERGWNQPADRRSVARTMRGGSNCGLIRSRGGPTAQAGLVVVVRSGMSWVHWRASQGKAAPLRWRTGMPAA